MKKIICLLLSLLIVIGICGCGNGSEKTDSGQNPTKTETVYDHDADATVLVSPQIGDVILENELAKICYNGFDVAYSESGFDHQDIYVKLDIYAKKSCTVLSDITKMSVNEFFDPGEVEGLFSTSFDEGEKSDEILSMTFTDNLNLNDNSDIERISLGLCFSTPDYVNQEGIDIYEKVVIYPNGKQTPTIKPIEETEDTKIIYDKDGIQMIIKNVEYSSYKNEVYYNLWIVNNSNKEFLCPLTQNIKEKNCEQQIPGIGGFPQPPNRIKVPLVYYELPFDKDQIPSQITLQITGEELNENHQPTGKILKTDEFTIDIKK